MKRFLHSLVLIMLGLVLYTTNVICQNNIAALLDSAENLQESNPLKALEYAELAEENL